MKYYRIENNNNKCLIVNYKNDLGFNITQYASNIDNIEMDTFSDRENFFSYRRSIIENDEDYGRCISVIFMT